MSDDSIVVETTRRIFADLADPQTLNAAKDDAWKTALWSALEESGLTLAWVPEEAGGAGAEMADGFDVLRISGQYAAPAPLAETLLAGLTLARAGIALPDGPMTVGPIRDGDALRLAGGTVSGRARAVPFARDALHLVAMVEDEAGAAHVALIAIGDAAAADRAADLGAGRADLHFDGVAPAALAPAPEGFGPADFQRLGAVMRVQQMAGALETALDMCTRYVQERVAFGKPIGKFQAVQQNLARLAGEVAAALTAASSSADTLEKWMAGDADITPEDLFLECASAKIRTGEAANEGAAIAHQAHGAIGFTNEYVLQRYTRTLFGWRDDFGGEARWALNLGNAMAARGADALWPALTRR
ncbi:MAG: acyl-CoA dehydrogenase [Pseudomonadota bacterium]|nr:acyl-CoA dehydrogenase [Pseudomonadota bacterium]MEE3101554.1 acyl-CoA dehydrogenase [Pseudomonadota bacterium]